METIRHAGEGDAVRLTEIAHAAKRHWGYPEAWIAAWRDPLTLTPEYLAKQHVRLAELDGTTAGFYALRKNRDFAELEHLWVDPAFMGRGLGRKLMACAVEVCRSEGIGRIEIDSDPYAESFYVHLGARRTGKTPAPAEGDPERYLPRLTLDVGLADAD